MKLQPLPRVLAFLAVTTLACPSALQARTPVTCASPAATTQRATEYFVSLADRDRNLAHVSVRLPQASGNVTLDMPVWNALYQVRDFAANLENMQAHDQSGNPAPLLKTQTSEWQLPSAAGCVVLDYDIHLTAGGPFGSQLNSAHGFFNWAMVLLYSPATRHLPASLQFLDVPPAWRLRDLNILGAAAPGHVESVVGVASSYDQLVDSPAEVGQFQSFDFQQDGATYHVVVHADPADYDSARLEDALQRITHAAVDWMGDRPFDSYTFLYHFPPGHGAGGMEHAYGTAIELNGDRLKNNPAAVNGVSSHEFFHLWNVKRIRPQSLEPVDYQRIMNIRALWFSEGLTSTVGDLMLSRAGLFSERQYIDRIAAEISELQGRPAHRWQSVEDSSLDAWFEGISFYRTPERSISYYNKGEVLGVLLDLRIRQFTGGRKSLRDLFRYMNETYAKRGIFFPDSAGVQQSAESITGQSFADFFRDYVAGVSELPYNEFFSFVGLQVAETTTHYVGPGFTTASNFAGEPEVAKVEANSEADRAGIRAGDRILQLNGKPATAAFDFVVSQMREGSSVKIRLANRIGERTLKLKLVGRDEKSFVLQDTPAVTPEQKTHRAAWIRGNNENGGVQ